MVNFLYRANRQAARRIPSRLYTYEEILNAFFDIFCFAIKYLLFAHYSHEGYEGILFSSYKEEANFLNRVGIHKTARFEPGNFGSLVNRPLAMQMDSLDFFAKFQVIEKHRIHSPLPKTFSVQVSMSFKLSCS